MTKFLHRMVGVVLLVIMLAGSVLVVFHSAGVAETYALKQYIVCCAAAAVFLLVVLYALTGISRRERDRYLSFPCEGGSISVSIRGIVEFISKLGREVDAVKGLRAKIIPGDGWIDVELDAKIRDRVQIQNACLLLQQRVRESLKESLGVTDVRNVTVNVRGIIRHRRRDSVDNEEYNG